MTNNPPNPPDISWLVPAVTLVGAAIGGAWVAVGTLAVAGVVVLNIAVMRHLSAEWLSGVASGEGAGAAAFFFFAKQLVAIPVFVALAWMFGVWPMVLGMGGLLAGLALQIAVSSSLSPSPYGVTS